MSLCKGKGPPLKDCKCAFCSGYYLAYYESIIKDKQRRGKDRK